MSDPNVIRDVGRGFADRSLGGINGRADASLYSQGQPRNILPPDAQKLLAEYSGGLTSEQAAALKYVLTYPNRAGQGFSVGKWGSGGEFPSAADMPQLVANIKATVKPVVAQDRGGLGMLLDMMRGKNGGR